MPGGRRDWRCRLARGGGRNNCTEIDPYAGDGACHAGIAVPPAREGRCDANEADEAGEQERRHRPVRLGRRTEAAPEDDLQADGEAADEERRKQILWQIERKLAEDYARPIISYGRVATCWRPYVKNMTLMVNSVFSGNRREDIWLDK